jgi:putative ABC transport system substrate-binding protein
MDQLPRFCSVVLLIAALAVVSGCSVLQSADPPRPRVARIGYLGSDPQLTAASLDRFREGLRDAGWVEGQNLVIEYRWYEDHPERVPDLAAELITSKPDVVTATVVPTALALLRATDSIPIVLLGVSDPVAAGLISSYARPGGNVTGTSRTAGRPLGPKLLELLGQIVPRLARVAVIYESANPLGVNDVQDIQAAAQSIGIDVRPVAIASPGDLEPQLDAALAGQPQAIIQSVGGSIIPFQQPTIVAFTIRHRLPSASSLATATTAGGLLYYGPDVPALARRAASHHVDRILRGAKPGDLPVEQATSFDLIINRTTAEALGVTMPQEVAAQVTQWID